MVEIINVSSIIRKQIYSIERDILDNTKEIEFDIRYRKIYKLFGEIGPMPRIDNEISYATIYSSQKMMNYANNYVKFRKLIKLKPRWKKKYDWYKTHFNVYIGCFEINILWDNRFGIYDEETMLWFPDGDVDPDGCSVDEILDIKYAMNYKIYSIDNAYKDIYINFNL